MSAHGHGTNPIFKVIGLLLLTAFIIGGMFYFFNHFPLFSITSTTPPTPRELKPFELVDRSTIAPPPAPATNPLKNTKWAWQYTEKSDGARTTPADAGRFVLSFSDDGKVGSTTDCNGLGGNYSVRDNTIRMSSFISTQMYCEGSLESIYSSDLLSATTFAISGNELRLILSGGKGVMIFNKR